MTDYKVTLKSNIQSVELNKKKVKINCYNNKAGNLVITTLSQNSSIFGGHSYDIAKGIDGAKDFNIKFDEKGHAETFKNTIQAILDDPTIVAEEAQKSGLQNLTANIKNAAQNVASAVLPALNGSQGAEPTSDSAAAPADGNDDSGNSKTLLIAGGAVLLVLVLVLVIWKTKK